MGKIGTLLVLLALMLGIAFYTSSTARENVATTTGLLSVWLTASMFAIWYPGWRRERP
ncbi:hypothetical protein ACFFK0_16485 [Paenibacillus chartarius]|uniref:Uncharacterized protein n=1 Tax=Paenibacillus chartarius TaxID=747481 RepID=A0ABV6DN01_9BACL